MGSLSMYELNIEVNSLKKKNIIQIDKILQKFLPIFVGQFFFFFVPKQLINVSQITYNLPHIFINSFLSFVCL